jgi:hypothetical protein
MWFERFAAWLKSKGRHRMIPRERDGKQEDYLERFYILSTRWIGVYLHRFWADDDDGLHDHPWNSVSILLSGGYIEEMPERQVVPYGPTIKKMRYPLHPVFFVRSKHDAHRITILRREDAVTEEEHHWVGAPIWSLFIRFGSKRRVWGFYRNGGWQPAEVQSRKELV